MQENNGRDTQKENHNFSKVIVVFSILTILTYTATVLYFAWNGKYVPDSLTYAFYGVFGVELSALAGIKIKETGGLDK